MEFVKQSKENEVLVVTISRGKSNALNAPMIEEIKSSIEEAVADDNVRGVVLASGSPKFFSTGFDVTEVFQYDREKMAEFFGRFIELYEAMFRLPKPLVAAVSGHAYAGGAVLALACDARIMAEGEFGFALNEINLGVVVPPGMIGMATHAVGVRNAWRMAVGGKTVTPAEALEFGLATEVVKPEAVLERAVGLAREMGGKPPLAFGAVKRLFLETTGQHPTGNDCAWLKEFIEHWFSPEATQRKQALIESLRG